MALGGLKIRLPQGIVCSNPFLDNGLFRPTENLAARVPFRGAAVHVRDRRLGQLSMANLSTPGFALPAVSFKLW